MFTSGLCMLQMWINILPLITKKGFWPDNWLFSLEQLETFHCKVATVCVFGNRVKTKSIAKPPFIHTFKPGGGDV